MIWFFIFFFISGFCSLVYQITWLRIAMADFGVTTPLISIVLSVFMGGLALGSWGGGRVLSSMKRTSAPKSLRLYSAIEAMIGFSGIVVAPLLMIGRELLFTTTSASWDSNLYYLASGAWISLILLPFCTCMGATFPIAMAAVRDAYPEKSETSFSYLYVANVFGAMAGTLLSAFILIELIGFRGTTMLAAFLNLIVAFFAIRLSTRLPAEGEYSHVDQTPVANESSFGKNSDLLLLLFITGFASLAMEVIWTRQFVPFYGPVVYTFALILIVYLIATLIGSRIYRDWFQHHILISGDNGWKYLSILAGLFSLFPLFAADYRVPLGALRILLGIGPFCLVLGFLTPAILDRISSGDPRRAGFAYALNTLGCIIGPIIAGFLLLPFCGERWSLVFLSIPLFLLGIMPSRNTIKPSYSIIPVWYLSCTVIVAVLLVTYTTDFERSHPNGIVLRDHTATVIATGEGMKKRLLVNGVGITHLTTITKMMVHLPLSYLEKSPKQGLVLCLGMGTSYRSMLSWGIQSTVVELVPSVSALLPFFHSDGKQILVADNGKIVIDDARRFLERTSQSFDVIVVDPPPPIEAAASSLLYSREFYALVAKGLAPGGIFQQWIPNADPIVLAAMLKALQEQFPYVRVFSSMEGWGLHLLAGMSPIKTRTSEELAARLPKKAADDIVEWGPEATAEGQFAKVISREIPVSEIIGRFPDVSSLSDNKPINEYYLLRSSFGIQ